MIIVVDASVAASWFLRERCSDLARTLLTSGHQLIAPDIISIETGHALFTAVRQGRLSASDFRSSLDRMRSIFAGRIPMLEYEASAFEIAVRCKCSTYDACYIAVANLSRAPLATADERQVAACLMISQRVSRLENGFTDLLSS